MANKNDNYYFINGNNVESHCIYVPYKKSYVKNVRDISDYDMATVELGTDLRDALVDCNPLLNLNTYNYIGKYPYSRGIKIFKPIEIYKQDPYVKHAVDIFSQLIEERQFLYYNGKPLDLTNQYMVEQFINYVLSHLTPKEKETVFSKQSIIGKNIKTYRIENAYRFMEQISNYTQLRNLLINFINVKSGRFIPTTYKLKQMSDSLDNIEGLYTEDPDKIKQALEEYKAEILRVKSEEDKKKAQEELQKKTQEEYQQITLFDIFGDESLKSLKKKN